MCYFYASFTHLTQETTAASGRHKCNYGCGREDDRWTETEREKERKKDGRDTDCTAEDAPLLSLAECMQWLADERVMHGNGNYSSSRASTRKWTESIPDPCRTFQSICCPAPHHDHGRKQGRKEGRKEPESATPMERSKEARVSAGRIRMRGGREGGGRVRLRLHWGES